MTETVSVDQTSGAEPGVLGPLVLLVAPSVSEQMGGEAIKAIQIYLELERQGVRVRQLTHDRVRFEMEKNYPTMKVTYIPDFWEDPVQRFVLKFRATQWLLTLVFYWRASQYIRKLAKEEPDLIVHYTSPVSPVLPAFHVPGVPEIMGPINGNIHYPPAFRHRESRPYRARRLFHNVAKIVHRIFFSGRQRADVLLVAGGERTARSLRWAGCRPEQFVETLDSGIADRLFECPRIEHSGVNLDFVQNGRLVPHKGVDLILRAMQRTRLPVRMTVVGRGEEKPRIERLVAELGLGPRVTLIDWIPDHGSIPQFLRRFRAFVFPSLAEANGIVVQEAMALGLPVVCLDWGGPGLLVTPESGIAIKPLSEEHVVDELAKAMDRLAEDGELADRMSQAGRAIATDRGFAWSKLARVWIGIYNRLHAQRQPESRSAPAAGDLVPAVRDASPMRQGGNS